MVSTEIFDQECRRCRRLDAFLCEIKKQYPEYYARPVPPFGDDNPYLLVVGLAPGMHGANASGRPFTGDYAGLLLYQTLYDFGYASKSESTAVDDGLRLRGCRITNAVKCLPPKNKPTGDEINRCNSFLAAEIDSLPRDAVILALGNIAHQAVLKTYGLKLASARFAHNRMFSLPDDKTLVSSYHCSRYNVQTKRLTSEMFADVFKTIQSING